MDTQDQTPQRRLYKSAIQSQTIFFPNGKAAVFAPDMDRIGCYSTDDPGEIEILDREIAKGHPNLYIDARERFVTLDRTDPIAALRAKLRKELRAELAAEMVVATDPNRDMGESQQGKLNAASTRDIASVSAGGDGQSVAGRLAGLSIGTRIATSNANPTFQPLTK